jgi:hypothetical protein
MGRSTIKQLLISLMVLFIVTINIASLQDIAQNQTDKQQSDKKVFHMLKKIAREINETMPIVIESGLRCENVNALPGRKFQYNFTLTSLLKEEVDTTQIKNFIIKTKPVLTNAVRSDPTMELFRQQKVVLIYTYRDKHANFLYNIIIKPEDYQYSNQ